MAGIEYRIVAVHLQIMLKMAKKEESMSYIRICSNGTSHSLPFAFVCRFALSIDSRVDRTDELSLSGQSERAWPDPIREHNVYRIRCT